MTTSSLEVRVRSAPAKARRMAVWAFICVPGVLMGIGIAALHGSAPPYFDVAGAALLIPLFAYGLSRAATISLDADSDRIVIKNQFRTWVLRWEDVAAVEPSFRPAPFGSRIPSILFRTNSGKRIKAQAVPPGAAEREDVLRQLTSLGPARIASNPRLDSRPVRGTRT